MNIQRREFLSAVSTQTAFYCLGNPFRVAGNSNNYCQSFRQPAFSVIPVVGDGKWIWRDPPDETGFLEPRDYEVSIGMQFECTGDSSNLVGTTAAPVQFPEQKITELKIETVNCDAKVVPLNDSAGQMILSSDYLGKGQVAWAQANYKLKIFKSYFAFEKESFPEKQTTRQSPKEFLKNSPGIKADSKLVKKIMRQTIGESNHAWDKARNFYNWVWENIEGVPGKYTSVDEAIRKGRGDCEERACTFIALCRAAGIPARQVWVPSHVWAEIALHDYDGRWHWVPIHTAAYNWFGWTGAHEIILQKGDRLQLPGRKRTVRLIDDWYRIKGPQPKMKFTSTIKPVDEGPGRREKQRDGQWKVTADSNNRRLMRDR